MIYSTICTWYKDYTLYAKPTLPRRVLWGKIETAMYMLSLDGWTPVTETQMAKFDNGFMDVVTFYEESNDVII